MKKKRSEEWRRVVQYVISYIPQKLFRFRAFNKYSASSFEKETITLVRPDEYWDEYDSLVYVNTNGIKDYIQIILEREVLWNIIKHFRKEKQLPGLFSKVMDEKACQNLLDNILVASDEEVEEKIRNIQLQGRKAVRDFIDQNVSLTGKIIKENPITKVACFTEDVCSKMMWDRYADGYRGFTLEYDFSDYVYSKCAQCVEKNCPGRVHPNLFPVIYSDARYDATAIAQYYSALNMSIRTESENKLPFPDTLFWIKAFLYKDRETYACEKEWRLMCCCEGQRDEKYIEIGKVKPKAIYYGTRIAPEHKKILSDLAKAKQVQEYEMYVDNRTASYLLGYREI